MNLCPYVKNQYIVFFCASHGIWTWMRTDFCCSNIGQFLPSVLWHWWLGGRKGIRPVKTEWWGTGLVICLERGADLHMAQLMPLPLTVSCSRKIQIGFTFLVPAYPGRSGKPLNGCSNIGQLQAAADPRYCSDQWLLQPAAVSSQCQRASPVLSAC